MESKIRVSKSVQGILVMALRVGSLACKKEIEREFREHGPLLPNPNHEVSSDNTINSIFVLFFLVWIELFNTRVST